MSYLDVVSNIPSQLRDIFLSGAYFRLSEINGEGTFEYFSYSEGDKLAVYPFLKNEIVGFECTPSEGFFDIQSAYGYGGVISNSHDNGFIQSFFEKFDSYCSEKKIVAEFVRFHPLLNNYMFSSKKMTVIDDRETVIIDLTLSYDEIFKRQYTSKGRNVIRKAHKLGYRVGFQANPSIGLISEFHQIYSENMRNVNADDFYFFSLDYLLELFKNFPNSAYLGVVYDMNESVVCSSIFLHHKDFYHYHLSGRVSGADNCVNNFMIDEAVKHGISLGAKKFHLGGGLSNDKQDGLFKFKSSFSKDRGMFKIGKRVHNQEVYAKLVKEWEEKNPDKSETYINHLLKYRF
jgi:hypothetical protein